MDKTTQLHNIAIAAQNDIRGDFPEAAVEYDIYVEEIGPTTFGVIDMGESYQAAFEWYGGEWRDVGHDPVALRDRIIRRRSA